MSTQAQAGGGQGTRAGGQCAKDLFRSSIHSQHTNTHRPNSKREGQHLAHVTAFTTHQHAQITFTFTLNCHLARRTATGPVETQRGGRRVTRTNQTQKREEQHLANVTDASFLHSNRVYCE